MLFFIKERGRADHDLVVERTGARSRGSLELKLMPIGAPSVLADARKRASVRVRCEEAGGWPRRRAERQQIQKRRGEAAGRNRRRHEGHEDETAEDEMMIAVLFSSNYLIQDE